MEVVTVGVIRQKRGPVYVEWRIENYFSYADENVCLHSPSFFISDETWWRLCIYPNGQQRNSVYIPFYLQKGPSARKYDITYKLGIMKPDDSVIYTVQLRNEFEKKSYGNGWSRFFLRSDMLKFIDILTRNGVLRLFCIIRFNDYTIKDTASGTDSPRSYETLTENFKDLYLGGRVCDVTLTVKNKDFQFHKSILVARSPVFAAMFEHDMVEKQNNTVNITDCDPNSFKEFLLFLYTGKLENVLPSNVFGLYETAYKYDVKELMEECVLLMEHNLSVDTFSDVILVAVNYKESDLLKSATEYFAKNVETILPSTKWQLFMAQNLCLANELFMKYAKIKPETEKKLFFSHLRKTF